MGEIFGNFKISKKDVFVKKNFPPAKIISMLDSDDEEFNNLALVYIEEMLVFPTEYKDELQKLYIHIRDSNLPKYTDDRYCGHSSFIDSKRLLKRWNFDLSSIDGADLSLAQK